MDLFQKAAESIASANAPLAERMRPRSLSELVGQEHLLGEGKVLRLAVERGKVPSLILWGPPGTGKTTLARVIAQHTDSEFVAFSAVLGGVVTYASVSAVRGTKAPSAFEAAVLRVATRYAGGRRSAFHYARGKMLGDPVVRRVWELAAEETLGEVSDVGSGRGQLGILLLESGGATKVTGFDWDRAKVKDAGRAASGLAASFEEGDLRTHDVASCDTAVLVDVLHYLTDEEQDALLVRAARAARQRVVIRDLDPDRGWRSRMTRVQEAVTTAVRWNRGARVRVRPIACITRVLEAEGFEVVVEPCWAGTPFANVLVLGRRA